MSPNTRQRFVSIATDLFLEQGYHATGVAQICKQAGASKGSFYHLFPSKEDLGVAVLDAWFTGGAKAFASMAGDGGVHGFLQRVEDSAIDMWSNGCVLGGFSMELAATHPELGELVANQFASFAETLAPHFEPAVRPGGPSALELSELFLCIVEGAIALSRAYDDPQRIPTAVRHFRLTLPAD